MKIFLLSILVVILTIASLRGQLPDKKQYKASPVSSAPVINGILDDDVWQSGNWADDFTQNEPYNGRKASQKTEFKILFDEDNLYVAIKAYDTDPDSIVNRLSRRDQVDGDLVGIIIDSFHDLRTGFLFGVSSSGVKYDQMFSNDGQNEDSSWDPNWWVKTSINNEGWVAEMKIPFSQVRFEKNSGDVWGMNIARILYRENETTFWQHIPRDAPGFIHLIGELSGLEKIKPKKIFDITPYGVAKVETFKSDPENPFLAKGRLSKLNGGIDAKIGITNNMTMDLTINPDFGQIEADPSEVNLTAYETFFSEKRPFFIEGSNITNFSLGIGDGDVGNDNLFYSRRIGRRPQRYPDLDDRWHADLPTQSTILGAAKLTGKTKDGLSLGFVNAVTAEEKAEIDTVGGTMYETVEPLTNYMIGRVQKDINDGKTLIGGIITSTNRVLDTKLSDILHKSAYTGGVDFTQYLKDKSWSVNINTAFSLVEGSEKAMEKTQISSAHYFQRPDNDYTELDTTRTKLAGSGGRMQIMKLNGHWNLMSSTTWKTPGFETNDLGYLQSADQVLTVLWAGYNQWEPKWIYRRYNINFDVYSLWNFGGYNIGKGFEFNASMGFKNFWSAWMRGNINGSSLSAGTLRGGPMIDLPGDANFIAGFSSDNRKKLVFNAHAKGVQGKENSSNTFHWEIEIEYKPTDYLVISTNPSFTKSSSELQYVTVENINNTDKYIFASINRETISMSFRVNLNLSPNLTLQYWGQPFIATGNYFDHKLIIDPIADSYRDRFITYSENQIELDNDHYNIDENSDGITDYSFDKNDFNVQEFLSNMVLRWEYNPGSSVYLVWNQTRSNSNDTGYLDLLNDLDKLFDNKNHKPHNIFLIKFSYRFGLK
jgi:uncharacterized protein DUF5916/cellulose/xylan binding protein with CBM9 domain